MNISASAKHSTLITKRDNVNHPVLHLVKETCNSSQNGFELQLEAVFSSDGRIADIKLENH